MSWRIWAVVRSWFSRDTSTDEPKDDSHVPSPLDRSVRFAHGSPDSEIDRELRAIEERANEIENERRER